MEYAKPFLTCEQQAGRLLARGMEAGRDALMRHLEEVGYYRLSGYRYIFKKNDRDGFREGTTFGRVWGPYVFDRQFRLVVLDAVGRVGVHLHTQLTNLPAKESELFGFLERSDLPRLDKGGYDKFMGRCRDAYRRSREPFAIHFRDTYEDAHEPPPYWMLATMRTRRDFPAMWSDTTY